MNNQNQLSLSLNGRKIDFEISKFPAGESMIRLKLPLWNASVKEALCSISLNFKENGDLIDLLLLTDAVRESFGHDVKIILVLYYLPYARQDRVCNKGESLSIKVIAGIINSQKYHQVLCKDVHSDVGVALIDNIVNIPMFLSGDGLPRRHPDAVLVSPDAGANKKVFAFAKAHQYTSVVRADKTRDPLTGNITGTEVFSDHIGDRDFLVLDDICDGGKTFVELAKQLRKLTNGKIYLYVSHGIFSKGYGELSKHIDHIYASNMMCNTPSLLVTVLE
jgi:ribose-phosphate pyrophosphokinase